MRVVQSALTRIACGCVAAGLMSTTAVAQETVRGTRLEVAIRSAAATMAPALLTQAPPVPDGAAATNKKKLTVTFGADAPFLTGYVFRGIVQEFDPKLTVQPFLDFGVAVSETTTVNVGTWNSFHTGSLKDNLDGPYYESDLYASATFITGTASGTP